MKRFHKTVSTMRKLHTEIVGLMYDIKELLRQYRGNLIIIAVGISIAFFNQNRDNPGMFFILFWKRSTQKYSETTQSNGDYLKTFQTLTEETTIKTVLTPTQPITEGIFGFLFDFFRHNAIFERSTIALGFVCIILWFGCMCACYCCLKNRKQVFALKRRNDLFRKSKNSDENIPNADTDSDRVIFTRNNIDIEASAVIHENVRGHTGASAIVNENVELGVRKRSLSETSV